ncbi:MAG: hypothetical protein DIU68_006490 [Chloroflexota bacterium]
MVSVRRCLSRSHRAAIVLACLCLLVALRVNDSEAQNDTPVEICSQLIASALEATEQFCQNTGRNQICYGHSLVQAEPQPALDDLPFHEQGDIVDAALLRALRVSSMNIDNGYWGIALMRLQANLPNTLPGQNVTFLLFGDVELASATTPTRTVNVVANTTLTVRTGPSNSSPPLNYLEAGQAAVATGRLQDMEWIRVRVPNAGLRDGWVHVSLITPLLGDFDNLEIVNLGATPPRYGPLQAFYLKTGATTATCDEQPVNGLLIQTPASAPEVTLAINDVEIALGSTIFVQAIPDELLTISTLEGMARITFGGVTQVAVAGTSVSTPLGPNLRAAGPPRPAQPYDRRLAGLAPLAALEYPVAAPPPLPASAVEQINTLVSQGEPLCGVTGLPPCSDTSISGHVTAKSATSLTVNGIDVQFSPNDPLLEEVEVGSYIGIDGVIEQDGSITPVDVVELPSAPASSPGSNSGADGDAAGSPNNNPGADDSSGPPPAAGNGFRGRGPDGQGPPGLRDDEPETRGNSGDNRGRGRGGS